VTRCSWSAMYRSTSSLSSPKSLLNHLKICVFFAVLAYFTCLWVGGEQNRWDLNKKTLLNHAEISSLKRMDGPRRWARHARHLSSLAPKPSHPRCWTPSPTVTLPCLPTYNRTLGSTTVLEPLRS
jgi:hypothetical protein